MGGVYFDDGNGRGVRPNPELEAIRARQQRIQELREDAERLAEEARRAGDWANFLHHAVNFYDAFFSSLSPAYPAVVAVLEARGNITPEMRQQLIAHTPTEQRVRTGGMIAGIVFGFVIGAASGAGQGAFQIGERSHFWALPSGANMSLRAADAQRISRTFGLLNIKFYIPGVLDYTYSVNNSAVFGIFKGILGQMANQVRAAVERSQDR